MCEEKKRREVERWEAEVKEIRTEEQVWKVVNRERKRRKRLNEGISMQEWDRYFRDLLGGVEGRVVMRSRREGEREEEEEELRREEVGEVVGKLREGRAMGSDRIPNEVWKFGGEVVKEWLWGGCNRVWRGEGWPEDWREGIIVPIGKKGEGGENGGLQWGDVSTNSVQCVRCCFGGKTEEGGRGEGLAAAESDGV